MQAIAETLKDGEPEHPETDPASALLVGDEHNLTVGYTLEMLAVGALAITLGGLHELVAHDPTVLEGEPPPRSRSADPAHTTEPLAPPSEHQAYSGHHTEKTCQEIKDPGRKRRILLHDSDFRGKFRIVQHFSCRNAFFPRISHPRTGFSGTFPQLRGCAMQHDSKKRPKNEIVRHLRSAERAKAVGTMRSWQEKHIQGAAFHTF